MNYCRASGVIPIKIQPATTSKMKFPTARNTLGIIDSPLFLSPHPFIFSFSNFIFLVAARLPAQLHSQMRYRLPGYHLLFMYVQFLSHIQRNLEQTLIISYTATVVSHGSLTTKSLFSLGTQRPTAQIENTKKFNTVRRKLLIFNLFLSSYEIVIDIYLISQNRKRFGVSIKLMLQNGCV